jgi:transcriptional repressor NrdR
MAIGEMVMEGAAPDRLGRLYPLRFSVYRDFSEARDFEEFAGSVVEMGRG